MIVHAQTSNVKVRLLFQLVVRILGITFVMLAATPESNTSVQAEEIRERLAHDIVRLESSSATVATSAPR